MLIPHVHVPYLSLRETKTFIQWARGLFRKTVILAVDGHLNLDTQKKGTLERPSVLQGDPGAVLAVVPCMAGKDSKILHFPGIEHRQFCELSKILLGK